ncbi:MAG: ester cyclase [Candidatus Dormibacteria bacterium]
MGQDQKELIYKIFDEIINQRQFDKIDEYFAEDFVDHGPGIELHGREAFRQNVNQWVGAFPDVRVEVSNVVVDGDTAGWLVRAVGTHTGDTLGFPATGKKMDVYSPNIGRMRDGKAVEHWSEQGMLETLQQLGVIPAMSAPQPVG